MIFSTALNKEKKYKKTVNGEYYIAPLYKVLIKEGFDVRYDLMGISELDFFGTPKEYMETLTKHGRF